MKRVAILIGAGALALAQPAMAQDAAPDMSGLAAAMGEMFKAEPLTPEQQARVPQAEVVVGQLFPAGTFQRMMDQMMGPMMDGIMGSIGQMPLADLARIGGVDEATLAGMGEARLGEAMAILDPAYEERNRLIGQVSIDLASALMERIEPSYRAGLARAFATRFSDSELAELQRFFATPVGARYAGESMLIQADPQVMAAMNELMPAMMEMLPDLMMNMQAKTAHLPPPRTAAELSEAELAQLAELFGTSASEMRERSREAGAEPDSAVW